MKSRKVILFLTILLAWVLHFSGYAAGNRSTLTGFKILTQKADGFVFEYALHPFSSTTVNIDGQTYTLFPEAQIAEGDEGKPQLPVDVLSLGIPFEAVVTARLVDVEYEVVQNQLIAPRPSHALADDSSLVPVYKIDGAAYVRDAFYPSSQLVVEPSFTLRQQRISTIRLFPCQYNPASRMLRRIVKAKIDVQFLEKESNLFARSAAADSDPYFEYMYRSLMANYEEAKQWRRPISSSASHRSDSTRHWFQTGRDYYRISIASDGWYRVTKADIAAAGGNPNLLDVSSVKVFGRGVEVPLLVRPDSTIEFFAMRKYGDFTYFDSYSDTNIYWLTWGGTSGLRYGTVPQPSGAPSADIRSVMVTKHFERNLFRYSGTTADEVVDDGDIPGEGWYWDSFYPTRQVDYALALDTIDAVQGPNATVRAWFYGTTAAGQPSPDPPTFNRVRISINSSSVGEQNFAQRRGFLFKATLPGSQLINGTNVATVYAVPTSVPYQQFNFDWIEIDYRRYLGAVNNQLSFSFDPVPGAAPVLFTASNFTSPQIYVFDLTGRRQITGGTITGSGTTGYSIAFKDTLSISKRYMVVASPGQFSVPPLQKKQFSDIRVNTLGADYLVITHRNFKTAANQLAAHRHAVNGVRTAVIDVQDIYDEFNYGVFNGDSVKPFLKYAYEQWSAPAPAYLLIFGDASPDPQKWDPLTTSVNFISGHGGYPTGDNWFACFDDSLTFLPSMLVGRMPVADSIHGSRMVSKVMDYENYPVGVWNKTTLAITGPLTVSEMSSFNSLSNSTISSYLAPPPLGMNTYRAYRSIFIPNVAVDDSKKQYMQGIVNNGVVLINYLGHAAGQTLALDFGNPHDLLNTNRQWPFVMAVSCNVGAFTTRYGRTLGEDFVLADNRGGIAMWGASGAGFAGAGTSLVSFYLQSVADSIRDFGTLTTQARYRLWQLSPSSYTYILQVKLTPLLGDPLSKLAIPLKPDLALTASAITLERGYAANDSLSTIKVNVSNYGLVPSDSVALRLTDTFNGQAFTIVNDKKLAPTRYADSLVVSWDASNQVGRHTLVGTVDPNNIINEVNEMNNVSASDKYVYANLLSVVKPFDNMVVPPGPQTLVVTSPLGLDSVGFSYFFELDTVDAFNSPFLISSGAVPPGVVSGQWTTPSLSNNLAYFWRCRTLYAGIEGNWVTSAFSTSADSPQAGLARWRESSRRQFARNKLSQSAATDSGVTLLKGNPVSISVRSLGARNGSQPNYFSSVSANAYRIDSYPWIWGNGFLVLKLNHLNGQYEVMGYNVPIEATAAGNMISYITNTAPGNYLAIAAIGDARTNVSEALYVALESLGSQMIRNAQTGQSWAMIAKKGTSGPGMPAIENLTNDSAVVNFLAPLSFGDSSGTVSTSGIVTPTLWSAFHWRANAPQGTDIKSMFLGVRSNGVADTLRVIPKDSTDVGLDFLNSLTSGPTYKTVKLGGLLSRTNEQVTPVLRDWWVDFIPPADLAVSSRTVGGLDLTIQKGDQLNLPVTVYNIGFRGVDSARVVVSVFDKYNNARPIASAMLDTIAVNGSKSTTIPISTTNFSRRVTLQVNVSPSKKYKDLVPDNNNAYYSFNVVGVSASGIQLYADGVQLMDGDFVASRPKLVVRIPKQTEEQGPRRTEFFVDNKSADDQAVSATDDQKASMQSGEDLTFTPQLSNGRHELKVRSIEANSLGSLDTLEQTVNVDVNGQMGILKLYNYPNPFSKDTYFTFVLTGDSRPEELHIRIFTIAGRRVKEIVVPQSELVVGFNRVYWDGRDADGDELANGYYFYKVTIKGQGQTESSVQKLAKIR